MIFNNDSPFNISRYTDTYGNLIIKKRTNIPFQIFGSKIEAGEILVQSEHVYIDGMYETGIQNQITDPTYFKVNYDEGVIFFHPSKEGQVVNVNFYAKARVDWKALNVALIDVNNNYNDKTAEGAFNEIATRMNNIVSSVTVDAEIKDVRVDTDSIVHPTAKSRIDNDYNNLNGKIGRFDENSITESSLSEAIGNDRSSISTTNNNLSALKMKFDNLRIVNVKDFGAKGDGTTDDTNAIQSAIDYINTIGGGVLFFPQGIYIVTRGFIITTSILIRGSGIYYNRNYRLYGTHAYNQNIRPNISTIKFDTVKSNVTMFTVVDNGTAGQQYGVDFTIENIMIDGSDGVAVKSSTATPNTKAKDFNINFTGSNANGLDLSQIQMCTVKNVMIVGFSGYGLQTGLWQEHQFINISLCGVGVLVYKGDGGLSTPYINFCKTAIQIGTTTTQAVTERINNCRIEWCEEYGIRLENTSSVDITGFIDRCGYAGIAGGMFTSEIWNLTIRATIQRCGAVYRGVDASTLVESDYQMAANICINKARGYNADIVNIGGNVNDDNTGGFAPCVGEILTRGIKVNAQNLANGFSGDSTMRLLSECTDMFHVVNGRPYAKDINGNTVMNISDSGQMRIDMYASSFFRVPFNYGVPANDTTKWANGCLVYDSQNYDLYIMKNNVMKKVTTS